MKKSLIALAALAATGAFAQVSVYGRLDVGYNSYTVTSGTAESKFNGVESHNSASSMWGVQGSEDLGGGLKATFKLEQDVYTANGVTGNSGTGNGAASTTNGFNRVSNVGLAGGFGAVTLGRNGSNFFGLVASSSVMGAGRFDTNGLAGGGGGSSNYANSVQYTTPNMSGFSAVVLVGGQDRSTTTTDVKTSVQQLTATYANGPLMVGAGVATGKATSGAVGAAESKDEANAIVASYDFGTFKLMGNIVNRKLTDTAAAVQEDKEVNVAASVPMGKVTLLAQIGNNTRTNSGGGDSKGQDYALGADYALSAKTALFLRTGVNGKLDASTGITEQKNAGTSIGIRTTF